MLLNGLISIFVVSQGIGRPEERERNWGRAGRLSFAILHGHGLWHPKTITIVISKITDYRSL